MGYLRRGLLLFVFFLRIVFIVFFGPALLSFVYFFIFTTYDYEVAILVADASMACSGRRNRPIWDLDLCKLCMETRYMVFSLKWMDLQLVEIVEEDSFSLALPTEEVDIVVDDTACVTVTTLWDHARLRALDPAEEF